MFLSKFESEAFNLNFYRSDEMFFKENNIDTQKEIIKKNNIDIVKFSIPSTKHALSNQFNAFRNFTFLTTNFQYYKDTSIIEDYPLLDNFRFEVVSVDKVDILSNMIKYIFEDTTFGYYKVSFLKDKITKAQEIKALQSYLIDMIDKPNRGIQFFIDNQKNEIIGFSSFFINEKNEIYRAYAGILPNKRNRKNYEYFIHTVLRYNFKNKISSISFGARADNLSLINKYNRLGFKLSGINYMYLALV